MMKRLRSTAGMIPLCCFFGYFWTLADYVALPWNGRPNTKLARESELRLEGLGAAQGGTYHDGKIYLYGDVPAGAAGNKDRVGVIREYDTDFKPTGRAIWLSKKEAPLIIHPTGLTFDPELGCFLGDTRGTVSTMYRLDWEQALKDGNLDNAVRDTLTDDAAHQGGRPLFVTWKGKKYIATADYGNNHPEVRLYDVATWLQTKRSTSPGVVVARFDAVPYNQNLLWDEASGTLTTVGNLAAGVGWRLVRFNLEDAITAGSMAAPEVATENRVLSPRTELEGYLRLPDGREIFVTSNQPNITSGVSKPIRRRR